MGENMHKILAAAILAVVLSISATARPASEEGTGYAVQFRAETFVPPDATPKDLRNRAASAAKERAALTGNAKGRVHLLVQFHVRPQPAVLAQLEKAGVAFLDPLDVRTWAASAARRGVRALARNDAVRWADLYPVSVKTSPKALREAPFEWQLRTGGRAAYSVLFHFDVTPAEVQELQRGPLNAGLESFDPRAFSVLHTAIVVIDPADLEALAASDIVRWIEPEEPPVEPDNVANVQPLSNVDDVQAAPYNLSGAGVSAGVWEASGAGVIRSTHNDLTPRVIDEPGQVTTLSGHATHVAGTLGSAGVAAVGTEGMAPAVTIANWDSADDANEMTNAATSAGAPGDPTPIVVSNHSYSIGIGWNNDGDAFTDNHDSFGEYTNTSQNFDTVVAQTGLAVFVSASNDRNDDWDGVTDVGIIPTPPNDCQHSGFNAGVDADCIKPRGASKNVVTVGSVNQGTAISTFSNYGPTDDGRLKPDLVAHGDAVLSLEDTSDTASGLRSGTSMATPAVAGMAVLLIEEATNMGLTLTPATIKAVLIQTARDVAGIGQATTGPDYATGWGIADIQAAVDLLQRPGGPGYLEDTLTVADGVGGAGALTYSFYVPPGQAETHMTLVWSDPAGDPALAQTVPKLVNDLDLRLIAPDSTVFTPWILDPTIPENAAVRNGGDDALNNVEQVSVQSPMEGIWVAEVSAKAASFPSGPQDFSLAGPLTDVKSDILMVLDRSGSMNLVSADPALTKLEALQAAADEFIDYVELVGGHQLGMTQFNAAVVPLSPVFDLQALDSASVADAHLAIANMVAGGSTNIIDGATEGTAQLTGPMALNARQILFLFSDGRHNTPAGSDITDIDAVVPTDMTFYSVGFGSTLNTVELEDMTSSRGGGHFEEQTLSATELSKLFMTVASLSVNEDVVIDPDFNLRRGGTARQRIFATADDSSLTFATHWETDNPDQLAFALTGPDTNCKIADKDHAGYATRGGARYRLIRVSLPYACADGGSILHEGYWTLGARNQGERENVAIMVLGGTKLRLSARAKADKAGAYLFASLHRNREILGEAVRVTALVRRNLPPRGDSTKEDQVGSDPKGRPQDPPKIPDLPKPERVVLTDDGTGGDGKKGDGVHTARLNLTTPGRYSVRFIAEYKVGEGVATREWRTAFTIGKR